MPWELANNLDINLQRIDPIDQEWIVKELQGVYDPFFDLSFDWDRETNPTA